MALATYSDLKAAVADYLMRDDAGTTAMIPTFIDMAERRIARQLRISAMETTATASLVAGAVALPDDFLEVRRIVGFGNYNVPLQWATPEWAAGSYSSGASGIPTFYTITGNTLTTYPNGGTGTVTMLYYAKPPALSDSNPTNWLLTKAPDLYLYASLIEAAPYLQDDARLATWKGLYDVALNDLQGRDDVGRYGGGVSRVAGPTP